MMPSSAQPTSRAKPIERSRRKFLLIPILCLAAGSCTLGTDFKSPQQPEGDSYDREAAPPLSAPGTKEVEQHLTLGKEISGQWWQLFQSGDLDKVVAQAIEGNKSLVAAEATLAQAQEIVNAAAGALSPQVDLSAGVSRNKSNGASAGFKTPPLVYNFFTIKPTLTYDLDIFGGTKRQIEQQRALAEVQEYQVAATWLTLTGDAVAQAILIASTRAQIATIEGIVEDDRQNLQLVTTAYNNGAVAQPDVDIARSQLASDRALLPPLRQQLSVARHALAVTLGQRPVDWTPPDFDLRTLAVPQDLPLSLPSELARQRPDILAAEAQLHAANAAVGVATAAQYPNITLTASLGADALNPGHFFTDAANVWSLGAGLTAPIFNGGTLAAQRRAAENAYRAVLANYQRTVVQALGQVADSLQALGHDAELLSVQQEAIDAAQSSVDLTRIAYTAGTVTVLQLLEAQRFLEQAKLGYVRAQAQRLADTAQLFVTLGGGWWDWREKSRKTAALEAIPPK